MDIKKYKALYKSLSIKKNLIGVEALEAVKQNGDALRYVKADFLTRK